MVTTAYLPCGSPGVLGAKADRSRLHTVCKTVYLLRVTRQDEGALCI